MPSDSGPDPSSGTPPRRQFSFDELLNYVKRNPLNCLLFFTRFGTLMFTLLHIAPILTNTSSLSYYQKALLASGATSAIRLNQRLSSFRLNRETWTQFLAEDSCHYLFYSVIFLYHTPITMVLFPISLFAFLHLIRAVLSVMEDTGIRGTYEQKLTMFLGRYTPAVLQTVALSEIFIMPVILLALITGMSSLFVPFFYYRFITFRYASRRNPYSCQTFRQLRVTIETYSMRPECPGFLRTVALKTVDVCCRLAPARLPEETPRAH